MPSVPNAVLMANDCHSSAWVPRASRAVSRVIT